MSVSRAIVDDATRDALLGLAVGDADVLKEAVDIREAEQQSSGLDPVTFGLAGPSTVGVHCRWAPGASGGGWLIDGGQEIDGINAYIEISAKHRTFGPYFSASTVGRLVAGL